VSHKLRGEERSYLAHWFLVCDGVYGHGVLVAGFEVVADECWA
jgi:hypothetical protein